MSVCGRGSVSASDLEHACVCFGSEGEESSEMREARQSALLSRTAVFPSAIGSGSFSEIT